MTAVLVSEDYAADVATLRQNPIVQKIAREFAKDIIDGKVSIKFFDDHNGMTRTRELFIKKGIHAQIIGSPVKALRAEVEEVLRNALL